MEKKTAGRVRAKLTKDGEIKLVGLRAGQALSKSEAKELLRSLVYAIQKQAAIVPAWESRLDHRMV